jgi:hypothetical protein
MTTTYDPDQQFKLFDHTGKVIASGSMSAVTEPILDSKSRAAAHQLLRDAAQAQDLIEQQQEQAEELRARQVSAFCDGINRLTKRLDALEAQREAAQVKADEEEAERIRKEMDFWPDPDDPAIYGPGGELHMLSAEPGTDPSAADQGALPAELRKGAPPESGNYPEPDPSKLAYPESPTQRAPVAVSMMSEDYANPAE